MRLEVDCANVRVCDKSGLLVTVLLIDSVKDFSKTDALTVRLKIDAMVAKEVPLSICTPERRKADKQSSATPAIKCKMEALGGP